MISTKGDLICFVQNVEKNYEQTQRFALIADILSITIKMLLQTI